MRKALLVTLLLSPVLLHAQANSPAQPQLALASHPSAPADRSVPSTPFRISTGVASPKLIYSVSVSSENTLPWTNVTVNKSVTVGMVVDKTGKPTNLKILKSAGPIVDKNVLQAVSQYRFRPGTVSDQPVDFPLSLEVNLVTSSR